MCSLYIFTRSSYNILFNYVINMISMELYRGDLYRACEGNSNLSSFDRFMATVVDLGIINNLENLPMPCARCAVGRRAAGRVGRDLLRGNIGGAARNGRTALNSVMRGGRLSRLGR